MVVAARQMGAGESVLNLFLTRVAGGGEIFRTRPTRPGADTASCTMGTASLSRG